ncbi:hypothetical protein SteCoe_11158 [Stentor coeruleus]|uniref:Uncharacterized protein n=1 Tax=Stentor coeruleus TaxID=5963 RepID=A0A1R2CDS3_9CILI|nr:hypothetical protein SteCoe_11158 [Stentor coeruleus]
MNERQPNATFSDFKKALKEYKAVISQAKSMQSLKNYHSKYRKHVKEQVRKTQEKNCNKINSLLVSKAKPVQTFKLFPFLFTLKSGKWPIRIPTTLYVDGLVKFLAKGRKKFKTFAGSEIYEIFLNDIPNFNDCPVCIFKPCQGKMQFFYNKNEVTNFIYQPNGPFGIYQYFVRPSKGKPSILIAHGKNGSTIKSYMIQNKDYKGISEHHLPDVGIVSRNSYNSGSNLISPTKCSFLSVSPEETGIQANTSCGILGRNQSQVLFKQNRSNISPQILSRIKSLDAKSCKIKPKGSKNDFDESNYIVNPHKPNSISVYSIKVPIPDIDRITKSLFLTLSKEYKKKYDKDLDEFKASFIKDSNLGWLLLKIKGIKCLQDAQDLTPNDSDSECSSSVSVEAKPRFSIKAAAFPIMFMQKKRNKKVSVNHIRVRSISKIKAKNSFQLLQPKTSLESLKNSTIDLSGLVERYENLKIKSKAIYKSE